MDDIIVYSSASCGYCVAAKNFLKARGLDYHEIRIDLDTAARLEMREKTQRTSVPQIIVNGTHVGGYDDLVALDRAGQFQALLEQTP
jgi:glutaredoxin 3